MMKSKGTSSVVLKSKKEAIELMKTYNPSLQVTCGMYPERCVMGNAPTLAEIRRDYGKEIAIKWLVIELNDFNSFVGVSEERKMDVKLMQSVSDMIIARYFYLKLSEILLFFQKLKYGEYGEMYGGVDALRIMRALKSFIEERNIIIDREEKRMREEKEKEEMKNAITSEEYERRKKERLHLLSGE